MYELLVWIASFFAFLTPTSYADAPQTDYIGVVAAEAAYSAALPGSAPVAPKKPVDPNCKTCDGTGKVRSGDGLGWSPCPTCQAEDSIKAEALQAPSAEITKPSRLPYQVK